MARTSKFLLHFSQRRKGGATQLSDNKYSLPTELWIIILNMAIHSIVSLHEIITPSDVPRCVLELCTLSEAYFLSNIPKEKQGRLSMNSWRNIRLVCQTWAAIINPRDAPCVFTKDDSRFRGRLHVKTLGIRDHSGWDALGVGSQCHKNILLTGSTITTVLLVRLPKEKRPMSGFLAYLIDNPRSFPNLRSLAIEGYRSLDQQFWSGLEIGYPDLVFLSIIDCDHSSGAATLSKLTTLLFGVDTSGSTPTLPSLKHLIIWTYEGCMDFITRQYAAGMVSLIIMPYPKLPFNISDTTILFPNLRMFGTTVECLEDTGNDSSARSTESQRLVSLPEHLWLLHTPMVSASDAIKVINRFRGVNRLTLKLASSSAYSAYLLRRKCRNNNIELVDTSQWPML